MVFSSLVFLFRFLPIFGIIYYITRPKYRNLVLFVGSLIFYAWGEPVYVLLMLFSTVCDYMHGIVIDHQLRTGRQKCARMALISSVIINLGVLCFFKYADFLIQIINQSAGLELSYFDLPLPIGISFYTFQTMSYTIDVYRRKAEIQRNIISFGSYVAMFPQLIAGPIVQYKTVVNELNNRKVTISQFYKGVLRLTAGLGKKVLIANQMGLLYEQALSGSQLTTVLTWLAVAAFGLQIYFDFSGYSDMAIGLGLMMGFHFPENFNYPYISRSVSEFWRRWHITLGSWFREYVYIPLGGNRKGMRRQIINLLLVWFLTGLWHGASWNFIFWGLYYFIFITIERLFLHRLLGKYKRAALLYTLFVVFTGWALFAFDQITVLSEVIKAMFGGAPFGMSDPFFWYLIYTNILLLAAAIIGASGLVKRWSAKIIFRNSLLAAIIEIAGLLVILIMVLANLINASYNPFLYFRF